jgi:transposase-like protein
MKHSQTEDPGIIMPACPRCQRAMKVSRIVPDQPGRETRTFRCVGCGEELSETAHSR